MVTKLHSWGNCSRNALSTSTISRGIALAVNPDLKDVANKIRERSQAMLRNPTAYEAPRH